ncbi:MAG: metal ABC transporter permease [Bdellovibrionales bacterium]|nr:metal ABC transporter permease [Bdellovibrionales bacterium]
MLALLSIYKFTILAGAVLAPALALLGCQLAARDRAVQTLCVAQGATLGVLLGIGVLHYSNVAESNVHYSTILSGFMVSVLTFYAGNRLVAHRLSSRNSYFTALFVILLAAASLVSAVFPALETHLAQVFFGDLATLTDRDSAITFVVGVLVLFWLVRSWRSMVDDSFSLMILGLPRSERSFDFISLLLLCFSVQFVGFLFTAACLFVPTTLLGLARGIGLKAHLLLCALMASFSVAMGFAFSLWQTHLPTVPTIVFVLAVCTAGVALSRGR